MAGGEAADGTMAGGTKEPLSVCSPCAVLQLKEVLTDRLELLAQSVWRMQIWPKMRPDLLPDLLRRSRASVT